LPSSQYEWINEDSNHNNLIQRMARSAAALTRRVH